MALSFANYKTIEGNCAVISSFLFHWGGENICTETHVFLVRLRIKFLCIHINHLILSKHRIKMFLRRRILQIIFAYGIFKTASD